jgi:hypothetical protein
LLDIRRSIRLSVGSSIVIAIVFILQNLSAASRVVNSKGARQGLAIRLAEAVSGNSSAPVVGSTWITRSAMTQRSAAPAADTSSTSAAKGLRLVNMF